MEEEEEACLCGWLRPERVERGMKIRWNYLDLALGSLPRYSVVVFLFFFLQCCFVLHTLPWLWLPDQVHCGSWMPSAAGGPVGGGPEAAGTQAKPVAPPEQREESGN